MMTRRTALAGIAAVAILTVGMPALAQDSTAAHVFNILPLKPDAREGFLPLMQTNARASREEAGNISFDAFESEDGRGDALLLFESWKSRNAHNEHMQLPHLKAVETAAGSALSGTPTSIWVIDVPGLPPHARKPIPDAETTRNVVVRLRVKPEGRNAFVEGFREVIPQARSARGNYVFDLYQEAGDPNGFVLVERWQSVAAHEAHLGQAYSKKLDGIVPGTLAQPPERYLLRDVVG